VTYTISKTHTLDGVEVRPGLRVWDYNLRRAIVVALQPYQNPAEGDWWDMQDVDGNPSSMMNCSRMWVRHPSTGERA
jgi:hypothetical protein